MAFRHLVNYFTNFKELTMKKNTNKLLQQSTLAALSTNAVPSSIEMLIEHQKIRHNYQISLIKKFGVFIAKLWSAYIEANKTFVKAHYVNGNKLYLNK